MFRYPTAQIINFLSPSEIGSRKQDADLGGPLVMIA